MPEIQTVYCPWCDYEANLCPGELDKLTSEPRDFDCGFCGNMFFCAKGKHGFEVDKGF